jgi:alkylhydroperoxidase/carboxymuconolactone decarboxylase family protein YurZ
MTPDALGVRDRLGSTVLAAGDLSRVSPKFAEGLARVREITDVDGALPGGIKALFMAGAASVKGHDSLTVHELSRAVAGGVTSEQLWGAAVAVLISRGEGVYARFVSAARTASPQLQPPEPQTPSTYDATAQGACDYFERYFGSVPSYIELMAALAPRALEGYFLMREWALAENLLEPKYVELMLCTVNAAEFSARFVDVHAGGARRSGASEAEIVEAVICAIPIAGVASWLPGADGIAAGAQSHPNSFA